MTKRLIRASGVNEELMKYILTYMTVNGSSEYVPYRPATYYKDNGDPGDPEEPEIATVSLRGIFRIEEIKWEFPDVTMKELKEVAEYMTEHWEDDDNIYDFILTDFEHFKKPPITRMGDVNHVEFTVDDNAVRLEAEFEHCEVDPNYDERERDDYQEDDVNPWW